ncbi:MAG: single-stranded-DNA-specific exonuclease RecJ [Spirochaetaceae bacterium]|jgi:single-stranded-DNA-specific exonuclease|nr:single-stranded-DNA-specific exonuclease RecJ [Spirochaetaceae bacterium]
MEWHKSELAPDDVKALAEKYGCDLLCASILLRRGITAGEEIRYYLENDLRHLRNPYDISGMEDAVERILAAKEEGEKVMVFGDRDVDGITGTVLLTSFLRRCGFDVRWRLPMGDEPYGLTVKAVEDFAADYGTLIITVDCGISNREEIARAAELGVGVVVTDHHNPPELLPDADALVNPKLPGRYPFRQLCGCAVAYKLVSALRFAMKSEVYGQPICLLNVRPSNEALIIEIAKLRNLTVIDTLTETIVPGMVSIADTRLPVFLSGQQILCWDLPVQQKLLVQAFGKGVEILMLDMAAEIGKAIPQVTGKSLFRLKELSKIGRYSGQGPGELDVLANLFVSFIQKKEGHFNEEDGADLQLAALGTIADIMPLRDENRLIVRKGIEALVQKPRPGLSELLFKQDLTGPRPLSAEEISWQLTPVINAAGRMGHAEKAVSLFLGETAEERDTLALEITAMNSERKRLVEEICRHAEPEAHKSLPAFSENMAVFAGEGILPGLTGLVANRLADRFNVPSLAVTITGEEIKGSLRSVREYDLSFLLEQCADLFLRYGGHDFAAGFSMERANWDALLDRLKNITANMELKEAKEEALEIDAEIPLSYLSRLEDDAKVRGKKELYLINLLDRFEPFGEKNRPLLFLSRGLKITDIILMGKDGLKHVKLTLDSGQLKWPAIYWNAADRIKVDFDKGDTIDLVYAVSKNWFNGGITPQLIVKDLRVQK